MCFENISPTGLLYLIANRPENNVLRTFIFHLQQVAI